MSIFIIIYLELAWLNVVLDFIKTLSIGVEDVDKGARFVRMKLLVLYVKMDLFSAIQLNSVFAQLEDLSELMTSV
jgi:hypothetical protein